MQDWYFSLEGAINMTPKAIKALDDIAEREIMDHIRQRNMLFLEAAISTMLSVDNHDVVAKTLREQAEMLEDFG